MLVITLSLILGYGCTKKKQEIPPWMVNRGKGQVLEQAEEKQEIPLEIMNKGKIQTAEQNKTTLTENTKTPAEQILRPEEPLRNPFLTEEEEKAFADLDNRVPIDYLSLSAILYSAQESRAIINGRIVREGDIIDNKEIIKINPENIILKDADNEYTIRLKEVLRKDF